MIKTKEMHPFLKYPGGKTKEIPLVKNNMPPHVERYIEPFVGGGSIYFALNIPLSFINDKSSDLFYLYRLIKEQNSNLKMFLFMFDKVWAELSTKNINEVSLPEDIFSFEALNKYYVLAKRKKDRTVAKFKEQGTDISDKDLLKIEITARKTAFYMLVRKMYNEKRDNKPLHIACFYFLREYCYSSMFRFSSKGDFNVPYGGMSYNEKYMKVKIDYMFSEITRNYLEKTTIENLDFAEFLDGIGLKENDFIFLDPPYDSDFSTYDNNPFDKSEQIRLRDYLKTVPAKWMLIIKKTDFIYNLYEQFHIYEYDMNYLVSFKNRNDKDVKHLLITNYEITERGN